MKWLPIPAKREENPTVKVGQTSSFRQRQTYRPEVGEIKLN